MFCITVARLNLTGLIWIVTFNDLPPNYLSSFNGRMRWSLRCIGSLVEVILYYHNTHYIRFPASCTTHYSFCQVLYVVKNWSCRGRERGKSGLYTITTEDMVVNCGRTTQPLTPQRRGKGLSLSETSTDILTNPNNLPPNLSTTKHFFINWHSVRTIPRLLITLFLYVP